MGIYYLETKNGEYIRNQKIFMFLMSHKNMSEILGELEMLLVGTLATDESFHSFSQVLSNPHKCL